MGSVAMTCKLRAFQYCSEWEDITSKAVIGCLFLMTGNGSVSEASLGQLS